MNHSRTPVDPDERAGRQRLRLIAWGFVAGFAVISGRLVDLALTGPGGRATAAQATQETSHKRPELLDRNGIIVASDIQVASLFADPRSISDLDDTIDQLALALPELDRAFLRERLTRQRSFVWLKRGLTPKQQSMIHNLGLPGIDFVDETRRVYPAGRLLSHITGYVNVDNAGLAGMEQYLDSRRSSGRLGAAGADKLAPVRLSVDLRVQHVMRDELSKAIDAYSAKAAAGVMIDADTGEVVALASLPDYDPHLPQEAQQPDRINRIAKGVFELGSTFKAFTTAMALDEKVATLETSYDARTPIRVGNYSIGDYHAQRRILTLPEIFVYSSNIGAAKMALDVGIERHQAFLRKLGMFDRIGTELPETAEPLIPNPWKPISTMTVAFGHGLGVTPLHAAVAAAALVNGGRLIPPTFLPRTAAEADLYASQVIDADTSRKLRYLMRLNVNEGTARRAAATGYRVGGKTGTAEKAGPKGYDSDRLLTSFIGAFPMDAPRYVIVVLLDEPKGTKETFGFATSGWNAAPTTGAIVRRAAPMLGIAPDRDADEADAGILLAATN